MAADIAFYQRRAEQERRLADRSATPDARRVHREMAKRYARLIAELDSGNPAAP
ncbi:MULTISPECIES: hypothetical protein [Sphingomonas]|uniref:Uncharacterized protein n=1 Tax=Sphingomonas kyungheensis TaxID=1069987 RepID=A0ABU8GYA4_9SPHN|nr:MULTISPECIES: hypothetical protein [unclassified Sphingomonas]